MFNMSQPANILFTKLLSVQDHKLMRIFFCNSNTEYITENKSIMKNAHKALVGRKAFYGNLQQQYQRRCYVFSEQKEIPRKHFDYDTPQKSYEIWLFMFSEESYMFNIKLFITFTT